MTVRVVARILARPDRVVPLADLLRGLVAPTRREPGCVRYEILQADAAPAEFVSVEEWRSAADADAHLQTPHVKAALARVGDLVAAPPDIKVYTPLT